MTSKELLLELIKRQKKGAWYSENWDKLEPEIEVDKDGSRITFDSVEVGFSFDEKGRFLGIFNWRE